MSSAVTADHSDLGIQGNGPNLEFGPGEFKPTRIRPVEQLYDARVRYPDLPHSKRFAAAEVSGAAVRLAYGRDKDLPVEAKLAEIWGITRDPQVLGHCLGPHLAEEHPHEGDLAVIALLRLAGADEAAAERNAAWQRWKHQQRT